jgi:3-deoxy-D-manno-octulosonate 8-phosphate phosphatase (KDO 8-P phosphatase)
MLKKNIKEKLKKIKLLILDVDGVMTDGGIIMDSKGQELKQFNVRDGHGLKVLQRYGMKVAIITGRQSKVVEYRAKDLDIEEVYQKVFNKKEVFEKILKKHKLSADETAFLGDDIIDIPVLRRVGFSVAVADAVDVVKKSVDYITENKGGHGAVREVCEMILQAQGKWKEVAEKYDFKELI